MAAQLNARIDKVDTADKFKVGANPSPLNQFRLSITNLGAAISADDTSHVYLRGRLGSGEDALFLDETELRGCVISSSSGDWRVVWGKTDGGFQLDIFNFNTDAPILKKNEVLTITFTKVISKTAPGEALLTFVVAIPGLKQDGQDLSILKIADKPDIISFTSDPPEGVQNLPGEDIVLNWRVYNLNNVELTQVGIADPLAGDFSKDEGSKTISGIPADTEFCLRGYAGSRPIDRTLAVKVLRNDWYDLKKSLLEGDPGYPTPTNEDEAQALKTGPKRFELEPTLLFNANDQSLYGIFRHEFNGSERALLFQTRNPFAGWNFVESSVTDQEGSFIPDGFSTSPGIYFNDQLWLIGGSQINADITSNEVWRCNVKGTGKKVWENLGAADWPARMGHAVVEFNGKIWVMGGCDANTRALNDVWTLDAGKDGNKWKVQDKALWGPRCLISPTVYQKQIWVYGGTSEPSSVKLYDDLYAYGNGAWAAMKITDIIGGNESRKPVASCLQVFQNKFYLFGKFKTVARSDMSYLVESLAFSLSDLDSKTWSRFPSDRLQNWWGDTTSSYQLVNFKDKMLIARAQGRYDPNTVLKVYIP